MNIEKKVSNYLDTYEIASLQEAKEISEIAKTVSEGKVKRTSIWIEMLGIIAPIGAYLIAMVYTWRKELEGTNSSTAGKAAMRDLFNLRKRM